MPWKIEDEAVAVQDGNPVWVYEGGDNDGKEAPVEFDKTLTTISNLTGESVQRKNTIKELKAELSPYKDAGIEDFGEYLAVAKKNADTVANLADKDIVAAGEVEKVKKSVEEGWERKLASAQEAHAGELATRDTIIGSKDDNIRMMVIQSAFDTSEFLAKKTVLPPDIAYNTFGKHFKVQEVNGKPVGFAYDDTDEKIMSILNPGEYATPNEAIEILVNNYKQKDSILKATQSGSGQQNNNAGEGASLQAQYDTAQKAGNTMGMIAIKSKMQEAGLPLPV
jgi:hypothetical protein